MASTNINRILNTFTNKPIHTNITKSEHLALENVRKGKDCIIVTADRDVALVVTDKTEYITKCEALLQDNSVYQHPSKDTSPTIHKELIKILQAYKNNNFISETEYNQLRPHGSNSPAARFYGLPKIHKNNMPIHPIVSACGTATYNTVKFTTKILQNYCDKTSSFVKDRTDFIKKIKHHSINPEEETLVSFDVSALFISIPVPVALQVINSKISTINNVCKIPKPKISSFWNLLSSTASSSPRNSINNYRMQPLVHITNIYMEYFESLAIPSSPTWIKWWFRYVDDVHRPPGKIKVNKLQEHLNSIDPHMKFTIELPGTDRLPFQDALTKPTSNSTESTVYRKPTHTDRYLPNNS